MNKKPTTTKKTQTKSDKTPFYKRKWVIVTIILTVGASLLLGGQFLHRKNQAKQKAESVLAAVHGLPGQVVYEDVRDAGCSSTERGWFGSSTSCGYIGVLIYKSSNNTEASYQEMVSILESLGYGSHYFSGKLNIDVEIYPDPKLQRTVDQQFGISKDFSLQGNERLYGMKIYSSYLDF